MIVKITSLTKRQGSPAQFTGGTNVAGQAVSLNRDSSASGSTCHQDIHNILGTTSSTTLEEMNSRLKAIGGLYVITRTQVSEYSRDMSRAVTDQDGNPVPHPTESGLFKLATPINIEVARGIYTTQEECVSVATPEDVAQMNKDNQQRNIAMSAARDEGTRANAAAEAKQKALEAIRAKFAAKPATNKPDVTATADAGTTPIAETETNPFADPIGG